MIQLIQMWALVELLGLICLPLTVTVFHNLPDRGWAFGKAIGMATLAFCVWLPLMCFHSWPFSQLFIAGTALVLLACCLAGFVRVRQTIVKLVRHNMPYVVATELLFFGMVLLLGWLRTFGPAINTNEMFMDEGFISAIMRSPHLPPNDMWLSGYSINYYYYAHYVIVVLAKLIGQSPSIAFNTGICIYFGLTAVNLFGVTCNIVAWARHLRARRKADADPTAEQPAVVMPSLLPSVPYGLLTIIMGLLMGNLASTQDWFKNHGNPVTYDWYNPSRVVPNTINEFPAFSFLLSCFHAHVLALGFTVLAIGLAFNLFLEADGKGLYAFGRGWRLPFTLVMTALIIGGLFTMNGWDYPTYMGLALVCIALQQWLSYGARLSPMLLLDIFLAAASLVALSLLLFLPFWMTFTSPSQGIGLVAAQDRSPLPDELLIYGAFAFFFLSFLLASALKRPLFEQWQDQMLAGTSRLFSSNTLLFGLVLYLLVCLAVLLFVGNSITLVLSASIALLGFGLLFYNIFDRAHAFTLFLGALAFLLVAGCEVFFLRDVFVDQAPRMNTVFKFYFQAWALLSIACGAGTFFILESFRPALDVSALFARVQRSGLVIWGLVALVFLLAGIQYPLTAPYARFAHVDPQTQQVELTRTNSLDGMDFLQSDPVYPGDYAAIRWINANITGDPVIVEAVGGEYSTYGRVSVFTGLPTPVQWPGHEYQWRVTWLNRPDRALEFNQRPADVDQIYTNTNAAVVLATMARYHAQYLYVGPLEYAKYPGANLHRFSTFMQVVYSANGVTIYKVK